MKIPRAQLCNFYNFVLCLDDSFVIPKLYISLEPFILLKMMTIFHLEAILHNCIHYYWSLFRSIFKVGGTQWIEWKGLLSETPRPSTPQKEQEHKAVGLRAGGAGGPKVKASERLRWQMRQREFLRPGT